MYLQVVASTEEDLEKYKRIQALERKVIEEAILLEYADDDDEYFEETGSIRSSCPCCGQLIGLGHYKYCRGERLWNAVRELKQARGDA